LALESGTTRRLVYQQPLRPPTPVAPDAPVSGRPLHTAHYTAKGSFPTATTSYLLPSDTTDAAVSSSQFTQGAEGVEYAGTGTHMSINARAEVFMATGGRMRLR